MLYLQSKMRIFWDLWRLVGEPLFFTVIFCTERVLYRRLEGGVIISEVEGKVFLRGKALYCKDMKAVETLIKGIKRGWGRRNILTVR